MAYNLTNFMTDQMQDPNSALFNPTGNGQKTLVPPTAAASSLSANPNLAQTAQTLADPNVMSTSPNMPGGGQSAGGMGGAETGIGVGDQLNPTRPQFQGPESKAGQDVDGNDLLKKYTQGGSNSGGLLKMMAMFM